MKGHITSLEKQLLAKDEQINSLTVTSAAVAQTFDKIDERSTKMQEQFNQLYAHIQQNVLGEGGDRRKPQSRKPQNAGIAESSTPKKTSPKRRKSSQANPGFFDRLRKRWSKT